MAAEVKQDILFNFISDAAVFIEGVQQVMGGMDDLDRGIQKVEKNTSFLNQTLSTFAANLGVKVVEAATRAFGVLKEGFDRFIGFAQGATLESARIEVQWRTLSATAAKMGVTFGDVRKAIGELRAAGIKTSEALQVMTQWLSAQLPVERLQELSRAAQDLAVVLGTDSTQAMERFNWYVQTGNSELLRTVGIMSTSTQMEEKFAASIGKTREQLSDKERRLARVQGLLEATAAYAGSYERSLSDPFKRMTSLVREFSNVVESVGAVFVPIFGAAVDITSDLLEKIERLFRVTKKEAKETGREIGEWKEGFLRLRAVVTAFANWFMSLWERLTSGFGDKAEGMMDRFVNAIVRGVRAAADALRRFARFMASVLGGRAPAEVTAEAIARTKPAPGPEAPTAPIPTAEPAYVPAAPGEAAKLRGKPVAPPKPEDIARLAQVRGQLAAMAAKLADASAKAARAREALARAEAALEKASQRVYDIREKLQRLEILWAEVPERFVRGRKRALALELLGASREERERKKVVDAEREKLQLAERYEREVSQMTDKLRREAEKLGDTISRQAEKYGEWLDKLRLAEEMKLVEPVQAVADEFESLDDLTAGYLEEIEGQLQPAFADIELSIQSIVGSLGKAWETAKGWGKEVWDWLTKIRNWFTDLPPWAQKLLLGAIALKFLPVGGDILRTAIIAVFKGIGLIVSLGTTGLAAGALLATLAFTLWPLLDEGVRAKWREFFDEVVAGNVGEALKKGAEATKAHIEGLPIEAEQLPMIGPSLVWGKVWLDAADEIVDGVSGLFRGRKPEIEGAVSEGVEQPVMSTFQRLSEDLVGFSVVPQMVEEVVGWFEKMTLDLSPHLDRLTDKLNILSNALRGIPTFPRDLVRFDAGQLKIVTVNLQGSTWGAGVSEWEVRDWIYEAIGGIV